MAGITVSVAEFLRAGLNPGARRSDAVTVTDSVRVVMHLGVRVAETVTVAEAYTRESLIDRPVRVADVVSVQMLSVLSVSAAETITVAEAGTRGLQLGVTRAEGVSVTDSARVGVNPGTRRADSVTVADVARVVLHLGVRRSETVAVAGQLAVWLLDEDQGLHLAEKPPQYSTLPRTEQGWRRLVADPGGWAWNPPAVVGGTVNTYLAQPFRLPASTSLYRLALSALFNADATDGVVLTIREGTETGTIVGTSEVVAAATLPAYTLGGYRRATTFTFSTPAPLTAGTLYWVRIERTGALSDSEFYFLGLSFDPLTPSSIIPQPAVAPVAFSLAGSYTFTQEEEGYAGSFALFELYTDLAPLPAGPDVTVLDVARVGLNPGTRRVEAVTVAEAVTLSLAVVRLTVHAADAVAVVSGNDDALLDENGDQILDEDGQPVFPEGSSPGLIVSLQLGTRRAETITVTDSAHVALGRLAVHAAENCTVTDAPHAAIRPTRIQVADAVTVTENITPLLVTTGSLAVAVNEAVTVTEFRKAVVTPLAAHLADVLSVSEATARRALSTLSRSVADVLTIAEYQLLSPQQRKAAEVLTVADVLHAALTPTRLRPADVLAIAESLKAALTPTSYRVSDSATVAESVKAVLRQLAVHAAEAVTVADVVRAVLPRLTVHAADAVSTVDSAKAIIPVLYGRAADAVTTDERLHVFVQPITVHAYEDVLVDEQVTKIANTQRLVADAVAVADVAALFLVTIVHFVTVDLRADGARSEIGGTLTGRVGPVGAFRRVPTLGGSMRNLSTPEVQAAQGSLRSTSQVGGTIRRLPGCTARLADTVAVVDRPDVELVP